MIDRHERGRPWLSAPPDDCTVLSIAVAADSVWVATDAGLWRRCGDVWRLIDCASRDPSRCRDRARWCGRDPGGMLLVAGLAGGVFYSVDGGEHWYSAWVDEIASSVTCFAVSPCFAIDRVVLAGTEQDGVLRSTDGGRRWRLANFGLTGYTILSLAAPLRWGRREEVFATTDEGMYVRRMAGAPGSRRTRVSRRVVQALGVSPQFAVDRTLYVGSEGSRAVSIDRRGRSWQLLSAEVRNVNCSVVAPDDPAAMVMRHGDGAILRSADGGVHWECGWQGPMAVLALAEQRVSLRRALQGWVACVARPRAHLGASSARWRANAAPFAIGRNAY